MFNFNLDNKKVIFGALAGVAVAALGLIIVYKDTKAKEEQETQKKIEEEVADRCAQNDMDLLDNKVTKAEHDDIEQRIHEEVKFKYDKKAQRRLRLLEKVTKVGLWANDNKEACVGITTLFGTATAIVAFVNGIREFGKKSKIQKQLDRIEKISDDREWVYKKGYNDSFDTTIKCIKAALTDPQYEGIFEMRSSDDVSLIKVKVAEAA